MSRWSLLALLAVVIGGGSTIAADRIHIRDWAFSGVRVPVGERVEVNLPAGPQLAYYESAGDLPTNVVLLEMTHDGMGVFERRAKENNEFRLLVGGWSGRSVWSFENLEPGWYTVFVKNAHYETYDDVPDNDRLVFAKDPPTLAEAMRTSWVIRITGSVVTLGLVVVFYTLHARAS